MPLYQYKCQECDHELDYYQGYHDEPLLDCEECGKPTLRRIPSLSMISVKGGTLGSLADANRKKLGTYGYEKRMKEFAENKAKCAEYTGRLPEGAKAVTKKASKVDTSLASLPPEKVEKYIMTGKK